MRNPLYMESAHSAKSDPRCLQDKKESTFKLLGDIFLFRDIVEALHNINGDHNGPGDKSHF